MTDKQNYFTYIDNTSGDTNKTYKQIIIDGVDVSGCENYIGANTKTHNCTLYDGYLRPCKNADCYYKQLKRAENQIVDFNKMVEAKEQECDMWKNLTVDNGAVALKYQKQLDQLRAENDKYSLFIEKLCDYAGLECDDEEQAMRTLSDLASQMNKARWIIDRYKQTLTEIKEIAKNGCYDDCGMPLDELSIILQKISEVEDVSSGS